MASPNNEKSAAVTSTEIPSEPPASQTGGFFPWLEDDEHRKLSSKVIRRFPVLGAIGIIGSGLTCLLSWMTLYFFDEHKVIDGGYFPKPAAWLSVILSLNSILAHMAVSQGVAVSWWYRASRDKATVEELHNVWATGSSISAALTTWNAFNYVALATVFVGTLPINGIILQNAMTSEISYRNFTKTANFSIAASLPSGFSADLNVDGSVGTYNLLWQAVIPNIVGNINGYYKTEDNLNSCKGECYGTVEAVGFKVEDVCPSYTVPYSLPSDTSTNTTSDSTIFSLDITWNVSAPYTIGVNSLVKKSSDCSGVYTVTNCTLQMAKVRYPVWVIYNSTNDAMWSWYNLEQGVDPTGGWSYYKPSESIEVYPVVAETNSTIFGGIASALQSFYGSSIIMHPTSSGTTLKYNGLFAQQLPVTSPDAPTDDFGLPLRLPDRCNSSFNDFWGFRDPTNFTLSTIRDALFYSSIYSASQHDSGSIVSVQTIPQTIDMVPITQYRVLWRYWAGSLVLTLAILVFILPTFYGFWTLARKTTLSPLETARAFHAPVLREVPRELDTPAMLKEVGKNNIHTDLMPVETSGRGSGQ